MPAIIRPRNADGSFGEPEKFGEGLTKDEQIELLGEQLAQEKLSNIKKDAIMNGLGTQVAQMKLEIMALKGGGA